MITLIIGCLIGFFLCIALLILGLLWVGEAGIAVAIL